MTIKHLSEMEIQQFVLIEMTSAIQAQEHLQTCEHCRARLEAYRLLFSEIRQQEKPYFDFDLSGLVLTQLTETTAKNTAGRSLILLFLIIVFTTVFITGFIFIKYLSAAFAGISIMIIYLIVVTALLLLLFQVFDMYRQYQTQMKFLDLT